MSNMKPRQLGASGYVLEHAMKEVFTLTHNGMEKETIEKAAANLADPNICKTDNWIAGAKWQAERMENVIKWEVDHDYSYGSYLLSGDYNGHRFVRAVRDNFWGIPLKYAKWCITRRYKILYPKQFK